MNRSRIGPFGFFLLLSMCLPLCGQQITVGNYQLQFHGFASQAFALSDNNNYLTMPTSQGTFQFTDGGLNVSTALTDRLRVGAQVYARRIGRIGNGHVNLDWAVVDYRLNNHLGFRVGKVKTVYGLYNDSQDVESLHTWALMPQSLYYLDGRSSIIAHLGGDLYGTFRLHGLGDLDYTAYTGRILTDMRDGYASAVSDLHFNLLNISGTTVGGDVRLRTVIPGLTAGISAQGYRIHPQISVPGLPQIRPISITNGHGVRVYGQYTIGNFRFDAEMDHMTTRTSVDVSSGGATLFNYEYDIPLKQWYVSGAYRVNRFWEVGTYYSKYSDTSNQVSSLPIAMRRVADQTFTIRFDPVRFIDFKLEGHIINGYGNPLFFRGFYERDNPNGLKPRTNLFIARLGFTF